MAFASPLLDNPIFCKNYISFSLTALTKRNSALNNGKSSHCLLARPSISQTPRLAIIVATAAEKACPRLSVSAFDSSHSRDFETAVFKKEKIRLAGDYNEYTVKGGEKGFHLLLDALIGVICGDSQKKEGLLVLPKGNNSNVSACGQLQSGGDQGPSCSFAAVVGAALMISCVFALMLAQVVMLRKLAQLGSTPQYVFNLTQPSLISVWKGVTIDQSFSPQVNHIPTPTQQDLASVVKDAVVKGAVNGAPVGRIIFSLLIGTAAYKFFSR